MKNAFFFLAVLALVMNIMAGLSPLWANAGGMQIEICSGDRWDVITIDENGNEIPSAPQPSHHQKKKCSTCLVSVAAALHHMPQHLALPLVFEAEKAQFYAFESRITLYRVQQSHVRGPPILT